MKILAVADEESRYLWNFYDKSKLADVDLILSAGDLKAEYLEFLVTMSGADVIYVNGNHDRKKPQGCICADGKLINYKGLRILGFGGSMRYSTGKNQYTEKEMRRRIGKCRFTIMRSSGFDILLTHAPMANVNDMPDPAHRGFECFADLVKKYSPKYFIHGHVHKSYGNFVREQKIGETTVINAFERYIIDI